MDEHDFQIISTLAKTRNITKAANLLYVSQSSLSKRISAIERELGVTILLRSRQGVHFTPEGEEICKRTIEIVNQLRLMKDTLEARKDYVSGTLNAGISINYALYRLPKILADFRNKFPYVNTHIVTDQSKNLYQKLKENIFDIAVIRGEYPWKGNKVLIEREKICVAVSLKDKGKPLNEIPFVGRKTDSSFEREVAQWMYENNIQPVQHGIYVDNITTCVEMVSRGVGWAVLPEICLSNFTGDVRPLYFENGEPFVRSTYLMYKDTAFSLPQVKAFINIIRNSQNIRVV